jgi:hypothetical protein
MSPEDAALWRDILNIKNSAAVENERRVLANHAKVQEAAQRNREGRKKQEQDAANREAAQREIARIREREAAEIKNRQFALELAKKEADEEKETMDLIKRLMAGEE